MTPYAATSAAFLSALCMVVTVVASAVEKTTTAVIFSTAALFLVTISLTYLIPAAADDMEDVFDDDPDEGES